MVLLKINLSLTTKALSKKTISRLKKYVYDVCVYATSYSPSCLRWLRSAVQEVARCHMHVHTTARSQKWRSVNGVHETSPPAVYRYVDLLDPIAASTPSFTSSSIRPSAAAAATTAAAATAATAAASCFLPHTHARTHTHTHTHTHISPASSAAPASSPTPLHSPPSRAFPSPPPASSAIHRRHCYCRRCLRCARPSPSPDTSRP